MSSSWENSTIKLGLKGVKCIFNSIKITREPTLLRFTTLLNLIRKFLVKDRIRIQFPLS